MEILNYNIKEDFASLDSNILSKGSFRVPYSTKKSKTIEFLDDLYTYPPKFRVKWSSIDELHEDLFISQNSQSDLFQGEEKPVKKTNYFLNTYIEGYFNKKTSSKFYSRLEKTTRDSFQTVPVYVVLNGQGEIVLATSTDTKNIVGSTYNFCGNFDTTIDKGTQLGLFFMSKEDAEIYLQEIAKSDTEGLNMLGLSIHCFGLDFAYRITRDYNPNIDFRFVPDLTEVQSLLTAKNTGNANFIFEDEQQQLRLRKRSVNLLPLPNIINWFIPFSSFLEKTEYFKGVPIYIVSVNEIPTNRFAEQWYKTLNLLDSIYGQAIKCVNTTIGFGNSWIIQGSSSDQLISSTKTYVFFEKSEAVNFCQNYNRQIYRYTGNRSKLFEPLTKRPKILIYNLEDFFELIEDKIQTIEVGSDLNFNTKKINFVPAKNSELDLSIYLSQNQKPILPKIAQFFTFKYRRLKGFVEIVLNTN